MPARRVALILGSVRKDALSRRAAKALIAMQPPTLNLELVEVGDLPFYNQELETASPPAQWTRFRDAVKDVAAVLFVTPEYNRGVPGAMKNAVDVGSRPWGKGVWEGKPYAVVSTSPGPLGGYSANHQLRQNLSYFTMFLMHQPEMYLGTIDKLVDASGKVTDDKARELFTQFLTQFAAWIERSHIRAG
jgi:chromate reductase